MDTILNQNDPDYHIEQFWYGFKQSMINFYCIIKKSDSHIVSWSATLNRYKAEKNYIQIENCIRDYMTHYAFDLIQYSTSTHNDDILITNIKRWNRISTGFNFITSVQYSKIVIVFMIYLELKNMKEFDFIKSLPPVQEMIEKNDFEQIIMFSLKKEKTKLLDLLNKIPDYKLVDNIRRLFPNLNCHENIKTSKLCMEYRKLIT
jgi:hypothetical protein